MFVQQDFVEVVGGGRTEKRCVLRLNDAVDTMLVLFKGRSVPGCLGKENCLCALLQQLKVVAAPDPNIVGGGAATRPTLGQPDDLCRACQAALMLRDSPREYAAGSV